eukprot:15459059-Alexandrium_andersonii.AAC.1
MQRQLTDYMSTRNIDLAALQETRVPETTQFLTEKHHFILFGGEKKREYGGVGFVVSDKVKPAVRAAWSKSPRTAVLVLSTAGRDLVVINTYIPQSGRPKEEREAAFEELAETIEENISKGAILITGDFNSNLEAATSEEIDKGDTNASLLLELVSGFSLKFPAGRFLRDPTARMTHRAPGVNHPPRENLQGYSEIDFILVHCRWSSMIKSYRVDQQAPLNSDHFP